MVLKNIAITILGVLGLVVSTSVFFQIRDNQVAINLAESAKTNFYEINKQELLELENQRMSFLKNNRDLIPLKIASEEEYKKVFGNKSFVQFLSNKTSVYNPDIIIEKPKFVLYNQSEIERKRIQSLMVNLSELEKTQMLKKEKELLFNRIIVKTYSPIVKSHYDLRTVSLEFTSELRKYINTKEMKSRYKGTESLEEVLKSLTKEDFSNVVEKMIQAKIEKTAHKMKSNGNLNANLMSQSVLNYIMPVESLAQTIFKN